MKSGGWSEDVNDPEIVAAIQLLAETEGIFGETAGGVTLGVTQKLIEQGRITAGETTVICNTGNGLKTTDALVGRFELSEPILPRLADFERAMEGAYTGRNCYSQSCGGGELSVPDIEVRVPATSANLGCAFDCAALAVNRYLRARANVSGDIGIAFFYKGVNIDRIPSDKPNLLTQSIQRFAESRGKKLPGLRVDVESEIPVGVGLGSSAAAIVAGLVLGAKLLNVEIETGEILSLAAKIEGHPDNTTAAFLGGLTVAFMEEQSGRARYAKAKVPEDLKIIAIVPDVPLPTHAARAVLPATYSREDAVHNLQRTALLTAACFSGSFAIEPEFFRDRLHQPYRSRLIPGLEDCLDAKHPALLGVFLSGAGSSVLAFAREGEAEIAELLSQGFRRHGISTEAIFLRAENRGVIDLVHGEAGKI